MKLLRWRRIPPMASGAPGEHKDTCSSRAPPTSPGIGEVGRGGRRGGRRGGFLSLSSPLDFFYIRVSSPQLISLRHNSSLLDSTFLFMIHLLFPWLISFLLDSPSLSLTHLLSPSLSFSLLYSDLFSWLIFSLLDSSTLSLTQLLSPLLRISHLG